MPDYRILGLKRVFFFFNLPILLICDSLFICDSLACMVGKKMDNYNPIQLKKKKQKNWTSITCVMSGPFFLLSKKHKCASTCFQPSWLFLPRVENERALNTMAWTACMHWKWDNLSMGNLQLFTFSSAYWTCFSFASLLFHQSSLCRTPHQNESKRLNAPPHSISAQFKF